MEPSISEDAMERTGEAFELGEQLTVVVRQLAVGDLAPEFALEQFDPDTQAIRQVTLADSAGRVISSPSDRSVIARASPRLPGS